MINKRFFFLTPAFYADYPSNEFPELERKPLRPYIQICIQINDYYFAAPLRSNINHQNVFWSNKEKKSGIDFSKAIVITDIKYIDSKTNPHIRDDEFTALKGKDYQIEQGMIRYIKKYKKAKKKLDITANSNIYKYSTLKYFEEYL